MSQRAHIAIIGAGNMAEAMAAGWLRKEILEPQQLRVSDPDQKRRSLFQQLGLQASDDNRSAVRGAEMVLLAVKPQQLDAVLAEISAEISKEALIVSIAAGVRCERIEAHFARAQRVVRVMPNTPALVGEAASAVARGRHASDDDIQKVLRLFRALGHAIEVKESLMDAVTALSGSGPAYVFRFVEALRDAGVAVGLDANAALELSIQTLYGSAKMLLESEEAPEILRARVTSPGGTTQAAIKALDDQGFAKIIALAVEAAKKRSEELS